MLALVAAAAAAAQWAAEDEVVVQEVSEMACLAAAAFHRPADWE
jgi:hypothetical protein